VMTLSDLDEVPGGVPEYLGAGDRSGGPRSANSAGRRQLGSGPSRIADEVARSQRDVTLRGGDEISDVSPEVAALLRSQLQATGRSATDAPALSGKDAPVSRGRARGAKPAGRAVAKPATKRAVKPTAKVALKKPAARPKPKGSKGS
jgi:hypothetical protein